MSVLTAIAKINLALDMRNAENTFEALSNHRAHIAGLEEMHQDKYQDRLFSLKAQKRLSEVRMCNFGKFQQA